MVGVREAGELRRIGSALGVLLIATAAVAGATPGASTAPAAVKAFIVPKQRTTVPQGEAFRFSVAVRNTGSQTVKTDLVLSIAGPGGEPVAFFRDAMIVPGKGRVISDVSVTPSQWFRRVGKYRIVPTQPGGKPLPITVTKATVPVPVFENVTSSAGLSTSVPPALCAMFSNGAAWGDIDGDRDLDLFLTRMGLRAQLFVSNGRGRFVEQAGAREADVADALGASFADYDNDGDADLYVARKGSDALLRNDGNGRFRDVSQTAGISDAYRGMSVSWGDYDNDGWLDIYVANYANCIGDREGTETYPARLEYHPDKLYRSNGDGTFSDVTALLEKDPATTADGATTGAGFVAAWFDYDGDGDLDIYLANDFIGARPDHNRLWRNDGPAAGGKWTFTDVSKQSGTAYQMNTMGIGLGDFDRDLKLDVALSNIEANRLLLNKGGSFTDVAGAMGVGRPVQRATYKSVTWGVSFHDFNLDGWEDVYFAAGNIIRQLEQVVGVQRNELFVNNGNGRPFLDLSAPSRADDGGDSKGVAFADYDRDGDMDLFVVNQGGAPHLYRNVTPRGNRHWLEVSLVGTVSNRDACGARVIATVGSARLLRQVFCGSTSVNSGSQKAVHFGLGEATGVDKLAILWPSGKRQELTAVKVDRLLTVTEAGG